MTATQGEPTVPSWFVGAYAASPTRFGWHPQDEAAYLDGVYALPGLRGLEVPFGESLHAFDESWFLARLPRHLDVVLTLVGGTGARVRASRTFGLASTDPEGRAAAVEYCRSAASAVRRLNDAVGRNAVVAVEVHSAPHLRDGGSTGPMLATSLSELASSDWSGARLVVEHCDAQVDGQEAAKGYLPLEEEVAAVQAAKERSGGDIGVSVNWGRSAIEGRDAGTPLRHVRAARDAGLLAGVVFSGCAPVPTPFGAAWADSHLPPSPLPDEGPTRGASERELLAPESLMTADRVRETVEAAGPMGDRDFMGLKIAPLKDATVAERVRTVSESLAVLRAATAPEATP